MDLGFFANSKVTCWVKHIYSIRRQEKEPKFDERKGAVKE